MRVLVTYASQSGSTEQIARRIAGRIARDGLGVSCLPADCVADLSRYDAVVAGSAIHGQHWLPAATAFMRRHAETLAGMPVWLFSVGMPAALARPLRRWAEQEGPGAVAEFVPGVRPRDCRLFSGVIRPEEVQGLARALFRAMGGRFGDFRDWPAIDGWADSIARALLPPWDVPAQRPPGLGDAVTRGR